MQPLFCIFWGQVNKATVSVWSGSKRWLSKPVTLRVEEPQSLDTCGSASSHMHLAPIGWPPEKAPLISVILCPWHCEGGRVGNTAMSELPWASVYPSHISHFPSRHQCSCRKKGCTSWPLWSVMLKYQVLEKSPKDLLWCYWKAIMASLWICAYF